MNKLTASNEVWGSLLAVFLILEILGLFAFTPWSTLSQTAWWNESTYPWLKTILLGFLIGLAVHIRFSTGLWKTTIGGIIIALVLNAWLSA